VQERAVALASSTEMNDALIEHLRASLALFRQGKPFRSE